VAFKSFRFSGLTGGLYASANLFDQPQGTLPRITNLVYTRRGGLQTVDGSRVIVKPNPDTNPGPYDPIASLQQYNPAGVPGIVPHLFGITLSKDDVANVIDLSIALWSGIFGGPFPNAGPVVSAVQFSNSMVFALGLGVLPQLYDPIQLPTLQPIANTFQATTNFPPWLASTQYQRGNKVIGAPAGSASSFIFVAQDIGVSGGLEPAWNGTVGSITFDGGIRWRNKGTVGAEGPPGAAFVFNHLNSLWVWGTSSVYSNTGLNAGIDGPDSLRMSDSGNPTSFDPSNQSFVGQGDGQMPMGGGVWTQLEVGIPATPQLVLFKTKSTYSVIGAFPVITIAAIPDGVGCAAPNTVQFVPGIGLMRMSIYGVAVFNGTRDQVDQYRPDPAVSVRRGGGRDRRRDRADRLDQYPEGDRVSDRESARLPAADAIGREQRRADAGILLRSAAQGVGGDRFSRRHAPWGVALQRRHREPIADPGERLQRRYREAVICRR
jgi:hypothetical protein